MYLSSKQARERMGVSRETLRTLIKSGELKASKVGHGRTSPLRISEQAIEDYMEAQAVQPAP
jgi:excisionase family DNA binding protein